MAKFHGNIGFAENYEARPGVWADRIVEREYFGDVLSKYFENRVSQDVNDDLTINNRISIVSDSYAFENFQFMKYVVYLGKKWKITNVDVQYPRLVLSMGGVYNAN